MTWSKLSDDYSDDAWTLSDAAFRLHTEGIVWSNRKLLDCAIPKDDLRRFAKTPEAVQELLDAGFWRDAGICYLIVHHSTYQRSREAVVKQQAANRENGGKGGRPKGKPREQKSQSVSDSQSQGLTGGFAAPEAAPDPSTLVNTGQKTHSVSDSPSKSETKRDRPGIEGINPAVFSKDPWDRAPEQSSVDAPIPADVDAGWLSGAWAPYGQGCVAHAGRPVAGCAGCGRAASRAGATA